MLSHVSLEHICKSFAEVTGKKIRIFNCITVPGSRVSCFLILHDSKSMFDRVDNDSKAFSLQKFFINAMKC